MEIEAKFLVSGRDVFDKLMNIDSVSEFSVSDPVLKEFSDIYLDTLDMAIYSSGFSFRCRDKKDKVVYTLKSLKSASYLIHMREETEFTLSEKLPVKEWNDCDLKNRVLKMTGSGNLFPLFLVEHKRTDLQVYNRERHVAELSFDDVIIICGNNKKSYLELEVELMGDGTEDELHQIAAFFRDEVGLVVGSSSKFDNGLELCMENIQQDAKSFDYGVNPDDVQITSLSIKDMFEEYSIEKEHARKVAENSLMLFDVLKPIHALDENLRQTLRFGALVHDIGVMTDVSTHHKVGRDILLSTCPEELPYPLYLFLPWMTFLHKKRIDKKKLLKLSQNKNFSRLPLQMQDDILKMSAILRLADALDYSRMDSKIVDIDLEKEDIVIKVKGPGADIDADRADTKADLWRLLFEKDVYFREDY
ncbi:CYTH domain-containing protein [uncultured Methanolobus sp.]|uniref:CYTH domain-containing protein n=1 Tax=uncultured Methanolobus sp. TaxID=218300 RepID=UPI0029C8D5F7|nr:CYTH domain-containing protein [uncultured Methanolobus sp.]